MNAQQLKNSILQEAIEGRLVPQDPNDEPASVLLDKIRAEKKQLVKEGKLKKKELEEIPFSEDEIPFEIPESWEWVRIKSIFDVCSARRVHEKDWRTSGIPFYRAREIGKLADNGFVDNDLFIDQQLYDEFSKSGVPKGGDLMITAVGTLGKVYIVKEGEIFYYKDGSVLCMENNWGINPLYAKYVIESPVFINQYIGESQGTTVATLTMVRVNQYLFPLPPLAEQKRIVAKIEELLPKVEAYGKAQESLDKLNEELPERLKKSILQEAIEGRLVPQDPNDEPASVLLDIIRAEKKRLVKEGKLKKKDLIEIPVEDEEVPFDLPKTWMWIRFGDLVSTSTGKTPARGEAEYWNNNDYPWVSISDMKQGEIVNRTKEFISKKAANDCFHNEISKKGTLIMSFKLTVGRTSILGLDAYHNEAIISIKTYADKDNNTRDYLAYILPIIANSGDSKDAIKGKTLNSTSIYNLLVPLPPLAEQKRIVAKIEEVFKEIDKLKNNG